MTEQSAAPLTRVPANSGQEPLRQVALARDLNLNPSYQRGSVWGPRRQRNLVRSLLLGIPVGNVYLNTRRDWTLVVVDGKQRIETIRAFLAGDLPVPASWFDPQDVLQTVVTDDGPYVTYTGLADRGRGKFDRCSITTQRTEFLTEDGERELFDLINFGGVPQGHSDI